MEVGGSQKIQTDPLLPISPMICQNSRVTAHQTQGCWKKIKTKPMIPQLLATAKHSNKHQHLRPPKSSPKSQHHPLIQKKTKTKIKSQHHNRRPTRTPPIHTRCTHRPIRSQSERPRFFKSARKLAHFSLPPCLCLPSLSASSSKRRRRLAPPDLRGKLRRRRRGHGVREDQGRQPHRRDGR